MKKPKVTEFYTGTNGVITVPKGGDIEKAMSAMDKHWVKIGGRVTLTPLYACNPDGTITPFEKTPEFNEAIRGVFKAEPKPYNP